MHIINSKFEIPCNATNAHTYEIPLQSCGRILLRSQNGATDTKIDLSAINKQLEETIRVARQVKEAEAAAAAAAQSSGSPIAQAPIPLKSNEPIQLSFNNELSSVSGNSGASSGSSSSSSIGATDVKALNTNDLQLSESKSPAIDELSLDSVEDTADLDDRNKRFLSFGGAGLAGGSSGGGTGASPSGNSLGGGAGGSGNFLLDVVRLFSGSVQTQQGDEAANSVSGGASSSSGSSTDDTDAGSDSTRTADGYTEGIPGPVTRLVVLANRGLANLVQDLILRVAATSEKFVNFKAKLITALI
ncbi:hypothetical protein AWZ03_009526 [Drosophila navojoa]|uniref:Uncharacterized protein n=1 Tax=Drosophila navojoa TaxID=7232 RepID=A0A484B599_DRONA|nr:hypothetical protein AWZ03_009526 [Drosophila navojoa]